MATAATSPDQQLGQNRFNRFDAVKVHFVASAVAQASRITVRVAPVGSTLGQANWSVVQLVAQGRPEVSAPAYWQDEVMPAALLLLDGASMWFRSYYGVPSSITSPDGRPVNALRGFLDTVAALITRERPTRLVVALDLDWRPQFRVDLIPSYKAHRVAEHNPDGEPDIEEVPDELTPQVDMILEMLDAFGITTAGAAGFEADDVLGTLAAGERRDRVVVASGDRDLLQVVTDEPVPVRVLYLGRGLTKATMFGPAEVAERYGVPADRAGPAYAELALLRGDPSDGLSGVAGIGEKTAATLLAQYGSLESVLTAARDPRSKLSKAYRRKLLDAEDYIEVAGPVVRVAADAPVTLSTGTDALPLAAAHPRKVADLAKKNGVGSSIGRLQKALDALPS
jgi:5'-3' exonuclease